MTRGSYDESERPAPKPLSAHEAGKLASRSDESEEPQPAPRADAFFDYIGGGALTSRQRQILELISEGLSDEEIGHAIARSVATVQKHIENLFRNLKVHSRAEALVVYIRAQKQDWKRERTRLIRQKRRLVLKVQALRQEKQRLNKQLAERPQ